MIEIDKVVRCPVVKATKGLIEIAPEVIAQLAGAVYDKDEWMTIGLGERKEKGLHVVITELWTPPKQIRRSSHVRPYRGDEPTEEEMFPNYVLERMICGIHSHNTMSARFSGSHGSKDSGDLSREGICSNYASSIVIATPRHGETESQMLGFEYEAIVSYEMECGELGVSNAMLSPLGVKDWPFDHKVVRPNVVTKLDSLGDCPNTLRYRTGLYSHKLAASCGLETTSGYSSAVFGRDSEPIFSQLPNPDHSTVTVVAYQGGQRVEVKDYWKKRREGEDSEEKTRVTDDLGDYTNDKWYQAYLEYMEER